MKAADLHESAALERLVRAAMAAGVACVAERMQRGEVDPSASLSKAVGDFPREFLQIRPSLVDDVIEEAGLLAGSAPDAYQRGAAAERARLAWWLRAGVEGPARVNLGTAAREELALLARLLDAANADPISRPWAEAPTGETR